MLIAVVGMARCAVPARVVARGTNFRATLAFEGVAPLHAARTSQRDVPTPLNTYTPLALWLLPNAVPSQINALPFEAAKDCGRQLAICSRNLAYTTAGDVAATHVQDGTLDQHLNK